MLTTPAFRSSYRVEIPDDIHLLLDSERESHVLTGRAYATVASLLNEGRSVDQILDAAVPGVSDAEVFYVLERLETMGAIREAESGEPGLIQAFWDSLGAEPAKASRAIHQSNVTTVGLEGVSTAPLDGALGALGCAPGNETADLHVVLVDDYLRAELAEINRQFVRMEQPWLLARPVGSVLWLGPLFRPGKTACWECLAHRVRGHRPIEIFAGSRPMAAALPSTELAAAGLIATEAAKWLAGVDTRIDGALVTIDLTTLTSETHAVVRRPQCEVCGDGDRTPAHPPEPIRLEHRGRVLAGDGGFRIADPETTLARYGHLVSRFTGVVQSLEPFSAGDATIAPVYFSGPNLAVRDGSIESLHGHFRNLSGGKGKTAAQARASALCEAIERYSGVFQGTEYRLRATYEMLGDAAVDPNANMLYSASQYSRRRETSASRYTRVPVPFDPGREVEWSPLWSLTSHRSLHLPTACCYYGYALPPEHRFTYADSNGCAAGNTMEEAILQGFFELVERDSVALWWYNRVRRPAVDLQSFDEPYFLALQRYYRSLGREIWVLDLTADLEIPVFAAVSRRTDTPSEAITFGFGAHLDARVAIVRALTEANQLLPYVSGGRAYDRGPDAESWLSAATVAGHPYLAPDPETTKSAADYPYSPRGDLKEEVEHCVAVAAGRGLEILVLDQTRPDIGLPVVRVVVPGLRHFWPRFGAGRLYDVPVSLGWIPAPIPEPELNPVPIFF